MCGIAGIYNIERGEGPIDPVILRAMTDALAHRGPDDVGYHVAEDLGLGFRRLSIIDIATGNQPMYNEDRSLVSVCNGEIFNFKEIREELRAAGHRFQTQCDVEILVHLYEEKREDFVNGLNGQFAFALHDSRRRTLFLGRDHAGIAPLFHAVAGGRLLFASEIKAILRHPDVRPEVDLTALDQVFSFPAVISPRTMFKGISSLAPGHLLKVKEGRLQTMEYWDLSYPKEGEIASSRSEAQYADELESLLLRSVKRRLHADVPVGLYLSGGLDSSLIASMARRLEPETSRRSFSIGFADAAIDERRYQRRMAEAVGSTHREIVFDGMEIEKRFRTMVYHAESPLKETYDTCSLALSEAVRQSGMKVVLTGEGADELFAGYVGYRFDGNRGPAEYGEDLLARELEEEISGCLWGDRTFVYEARQHELGQTKEALYSAAVGALYPEFDSVRNPVVEIAKLAGRHLLHKRSYLDFRLRLGHHLLSDHGDRVGYANSVEARYPFLDVELMEFVRTLPPGIHLSGFEEKHLLKKVAAKYLPEEITGREKFGFVAPGSTDLMRRNIEWVNDTLSHATVRRQGYFDADAVDRLKEIYTADGFRVNVPFEDDLLMIVLTFGVFLDLFDVPDFR
jgi:asparagine synthase (glutamine-hydrolysing)